MRGDAPGHLVVARLGGRDERDVVTRKTGGLPLGPPTLSRSGSSRDEDDPHGRLTG
jgi:hypothetical protein